MNDKSKPSFKLLKISQPPKPIEVKQYFVFDDYLELYKHYVLTVYSRSRYKSPVKFRVNLDNYRRTILNGEIYWTVGHLYNEEGLYLLTQEGYQKLLTTATQIWTLSSGNVPRTDLPASFSSKTFGDFDTKDELLKRFLGDPTSWGHEATRQLEQEIRLLENEIAENRVKIAQLGSDTFLSRYVELQLEIDVPITDWAIKAPEKGPDDDTTED